MQTEFNLYGHIHNLPIRWSHTNVSTGLWSYLEHKPDLKKKKLLTDLGKYTLYIHTPRFSAAFGTIN